jgi:hypothetical protein
MATFHAPPWCPSPPDTFLRLMISGLAFVSLLTCRDLQEGARPDGRLDRMDRRMTLKFG